MIVKPAKTDIVKQVQKQATLSLNAKLTVETALFESNLRYCHALLFLYWKGYAVDYMTGFEKGRLYKDAWVNLLFQCRIVFHFRCHVQLGLI